MKFESFSKEKGISLWCATLGIVLPTLFLGTSALAQPITFADGNSTVTLNPSTPSGMSSWTIDGANVLGQQSFWLGVNSSPVTPVSTISPAIVSGPTPTGGSTSLTTSYANSQVSLSAVYSLQGGTPGSGNSDLGEQIQIKNLGNTALTFHFYQYAAFQNVTSVKLTSAAGFFGDAYVTGAGALINEAVNTGVIPGPSEGETEAPGVTLAKLMSGSPGPLDGSTVGGANYTWAFEWDKTVSPGSSLIISKDLNVTLAVVVPEPAPWSLISLGLVGFGFFKWHLGRRGK